jgi:MGT family glycosyltransferase
MAKALVFVAPAHGHIHPTLPVVQELIVRGEEVVYYTTETFVPQVQATGAKAEVYQSIMSTPVPPATTSGGNAPAGSFLGSMPFRMADEARNVLPQILERARLEQADYALYDPMCLWGKMVSQILQLPAITLRPTYAMSENMATMRQMADRLPRPNPEMMSTVQRKMVDLGADYGISLPQNPFSLMVVAEPLNIVFLPRIFQFSGELFDERFVFVGPSITTRNDAQEVAKELHLESSDKPLLLISLGTVFNNRVDFFQQCFQAFADQPFRVILAYGSRLDRNSLGSIPDNFQAYPYVPQLDVLQHATAFLTHGGMNSTMEALYYGVPLVVIPQMAEQAMTAKRVTELHLGLDLEAEQVSVEALQAATNQVLSDASFKEHAVQMQAEIQQAGGYKRAADAILAHTSQKR